MNKAIGGGKSHNPGLLHGKSTTCRVGRQKEHNDVDLRTGEKLKEEGDVNNEQFSNTEIERGVVVSSVCTKPR